MEQNRKHRNRYSTDGHLIYDTGSIPDYVDKRGTSVNSGWTTIHSDKIQKHTPTLQLPQKPVSG